MTRAEFPASYSNVQTELFAKDSGVLNPESVSSPGGVRREESTAHTENRPDGLHLENSHYSDVEPVYFEDDWTEPAAVTSSAAVTESGIEKRKANLINRWKPGELVRLYLQ